MKKILTLAIIALTVGAAAFAQDGTVTRRFKVGNFDKLEVSVFNVEVRIGQPTGEVEVTVSEKYADNVDIEVSGRTLNIGFDGIAIKNNYVAKAVVTAPVLCGIEGEAAAAISLSGPIRTDRVEIDLSSAASLTAPAIIASESVSIDMSSAASANITKIETPSLESETASASKLTIGTLSAENTEFDASSASSVTINGGKTVKAEFDASSSAKINASALLAATGSADASSGASIRCNIAKPKYIDRSSGASIKNISQKNAPIGAK